MSQLPRRVTLQWTLAGRTALLLALCGLAVTVPSGSRHALFPAVVLAAFAVTAPVAWLNVRRLQAQTFERRTVRTGQRFTFLLALGKARSRVAPRDLVVHSDGDGPSTSRPLALVPDVVPGQWSDWVACEWRTRRRGPLRQLPLRIVSDYPLGFWRASAHLELEVDWLSLPQAARLHFDPTQRSVRRRERCHATHTRRGDEEFYALRDARPGDSPHRIHWRSSARRGKQVVRELRGEEQPESAVVLFGWVEAPAPAGKPHQRFEHAVSLVAALVERRAKAGEATMVRFDGRQPWSRRVPPTRAGVQAMLARLAVVECEAPKGGPAALRTALKSALIGDALVVHACPSVADEGRTLQRPARDAAYVVCATSKPRTAGTRS
ncbi:MAG: DUF58 domain-containing protein [Planctomycetes bacterium]|nr:DUF58 domain-containing protein [Planctomycetota bacterium]